MTEAEWLAATDSKPMLAFIQGKASDRKLRLFAVGCCRRLWHFTDDERGRAAVESAEGFADSRLSREQLNEAAYAAGRAYNDALGTDMADIAHGFAAAAAPDDFNDDPAFVAATTASHDITNAAAYLAVDDGPSDAWWVAKMAEATAQTVLLRDIIGNPFRPVTFSQSWRTSTAVALAAQMYESRDFSAMPILADALQDAGCDSADVLEHCRGPGPHVRGCWVVDLVLDKQ